MVDDELKPRHEPPKKPRIVKLGKSKNFLEPINSKKRPRDFRDVNGNELDISPIDWEFESNQKASIFELEDGSLELSVNQKGSTPGIRSKLPILLQPGSYVLTVVGFSESESGDDRVEKLVSLAQQNVPDIRFHRVAHFLLHLHEPHLDVPAGILGVDVGLEGDLLLFGGDHSLDVQVFGEVEGVDSVVLACWPLQAAK